MDDEEKWDNQSSTLNDEDVTERAHMWEDADARKAAKAERKIAKNQVRFDVVTKEDLEIVQDALHPEIKAAAEEITQGQGLYDNTIIDQNIGFTANTFRYSKLRQSVHAKKLFKNNGPPKDGNAIEDPKQVEEIAASICESLGIKTKQAKVSKERKNLDSRLRNAITNDLVAYENEQAETMERMAGYWRYANRRTYNQMVENNELWDWATGQKLLKVDEEPELDVIEEEDESPGADTHDANTPLTTPMTSPESQDNDDGFDVPAYSISPFIQRFPSEDDDGLKTPTQTSYAGYSRDYNDFAEETRKQFNGPHLSYSPGRSPGPTVTFNVPSPLSNDDDPYDGDWSDNNATSPLNIIKNFPLPPGRTKFNNATISPFTPPSTKPHQQLYNGKKDTRVLSRAVFVPSTSPPTDSSPQTPPQPIHWHCDPQHRRIPSPTTIPPPANRFEKLNRELPAPCDDPPAKTRIPTVEKGLGRIPNAKIQAKVINLDLPAERSPLEAEEGWTLHGKGAAAAAGAGGAGNVKKNHKNFPQLVSHGGRKTAGGGKGQTGKIAAVGSSYAKVAAAGKRR